MSVVLDASAVLAVLQVEAGAQAVIGVMRGAIMGTVNFSEAIAKAGEWTGDPDRLTVMIDRFDIRVLPFDRAQAIAAARLRGVTAGRGVSFADRACLALGQASGLPILTADRLWCDLGLDLDIRLFR